MLPHVKTLIMDHSQPFIILGIRFRLAALYELSMCDQPHLIRYLKNTMCTTPAKYAEPVVILSKSDLTNASDDFVQAVQSIDPLWLRR
jgi:hypothetical protein